MLAAALSFALGASGVATLLAFWRLLRGPDEPDRILALETLYGNLVALVLLLGIHQDTRLYFEAALLIAMFGFLGAVVLCRHLLRGGIFD